MSINVREPEKKFTPAPQGLHAAVCVDVLEPWTEERPEEYGGGLVDKTRIVWMIDEQMDDGRPFIATKKYTTSLHEKSNLCKDLTSWRGREFTADEKKGFDLERLIGVCCQLQIVHVARNDKVFANVTSVVPIAKGMPKMTVPVDYIRQKDRPDAQKTPPMAQDSSPDEFQAEADDVPFGLALVPLVGFILSRMA